MPPDASTAREDLAGRLEFRLDTDAPKGNVVPLLARLLRKMRDQARQRASEDKPAAAG